MVGMTTVSERLGPDFQMMTAVTASTSAPSKADVQAQIDAAPQTFQAMSNTLAEETERLTAAIAARDAEAMWESALRLDPTCVACHDRFWRSGRPIPD